jgi:hypothetical protein
MKCNYCLTGRGIFIRVPDTIIIKIIIKKLKANGINQDQNPLNKMISK